MSSLELESAGLTELIADNRANIDLLEEDREEAEKAAKKSGRIGRKADADL